jgi:PAS domain S-box-containing protein
MPDRGTEEILWITADGAHPAESGFLSADSILHASFCEPSRIEECLARANAEGRPPAAAVIGHDVPWPLRVARQVYRLAPLSHIVFLVRPQRLAEFRSEISRAPMIGTHWTIVDPRPDSLQPALQSAVKASRQRRQLRTTLDSINLRLSSELPARDSAEYRKLVISDKYLATILEHAQDAIVSLDPVGRIASWNQGAVALFGHQPEDSGKLRLEDLVVEGQRETVSRWFESAAAGTPAIQKEVECRRADLLTFIAEATLAPIRDDVGAVIAVSLTARDITDRKRDEEELKRIHTELEQRVAQRTAALRSVNRELEAFTYSASHDLRAPLRGIDGFSQALLEDYGNALDETAGRYIERIRSGARRMGEIIDSLLMLSRISQAELHLSDVDLGSLARDVVAELRELEPERTVELAVEPDLTLKADRQLIRIALANLLSNAWKFTRERELAVIEVGRERDREQPTFFVRDNGAGFDMAYRDKLFLPFQRLHHPLRFEGSGIGLGTVQRVIARHGGTVWAESTPDRGATFYFSLPDAPVEQALTDVGRPA